MVSQSWDDDYFGAALKLAERCGILDVRKLGSIVVVALVLLAACGGDDDETAAAPSTTVTTAAADTTDVIDGYCTIKAELDASDEADPRRLDDLLATTPDEIAEEVDAYVERRRAGDFYASEELDAYFDTHC